MGGQNMQQRIEGLEMKVSSLEHEHHLVKKDVSEITVSLKSLAESVQKLVITLDRGKWLAYGILIMAGIQILGINDFFKIILKGAL